MKTFMKKVLWLIVLTFSVIACRESDPTPDKSKEVVSKATNGQVSPVPDSHIK